MVKVDVKVKYDKYLEIERVHIFFKTKEELY
jgi:hypothetical protein